MSELISKHIVIRTADLYLKNKQGNLSHRSKFETVVNHFLLTCLKFYFGYLSENIVQRATRMMKITPNKATT